MECQTALESQCVKQRQKYADQQPLHDVLRLEEWNVSVTRSASTYVI